ncbi:hypothetical protein ABZ820_02320 [Streptomyces diacarni]|uniref:Uncharacterized protein n=1 Tax=Streptomyces diacarni TaxID=2800381 RepID=A0A367EUB8_9ACTN|nr:hypothetical protein DTL70_17610 [Streptomyces diacarni]
MRRAPTGRGGDTAGGGGRRSTSVGPWRAAPQADAGLSDGSPSDGGLSGGRPPGDELPGRGPSGGGPSGSAPVEGVPGVSSPGDGVPGVGPPGDGVPVDGALKGAAPSRAGFSPDGDAAVEERSERCPVRSVI